VKTTSARYSPSRAILFIIIIIFIFDLQLTAVFTPQIGGEMR
jgi:hypothetical protein